MDSPGEVFDGNLQGTEGEDVADGVSALVGWAVWMLVGTVRGRGRVIKPEDGVCRTRDPLVEGNCGIRLQCVTEHIQTRGCSHGGRHRAGV